MIFSPLLIALAMLVGCPSDTSPTANAAPVVQARAFQGTIYGGRQPIVGATVVAYAAGASVGAAATQIGSATTLSDGTFNISFTPTPAHDQIVYVTASGGNAGGGTNSAIGLMTVAGAYCESGTSGCDFPSNVNVNELTTVASAAALQDYTQFVDCSTITNNSRTGSCVSIPGAIDLSRMAASVGNLVNVVNGRASDFLTTYAANNTAFALTLEKMNTLANVLAACVNTAASDAACTSLLGDAFDASDTLAAAYRIAAYPAVDANGGLYERQPPGPQYSPILPSADAPSTVELQFWTVGGRHFAFSADYGINCSSDPNCNNNGWVSVFTISPLVGALTKVGGDYSAGANPRNITLGPDGKFLYAANQYSGNVSAWAVDPASGTLSPVAGSSCYSGGPTNCFDAGKQAHAVAVTPDGKYAYVANEGDNNVSYYSIDASTGALTHIADFSVDQKPYELTVVKNAAGDEFLYIADFVSGRVSTVSINADGSVTGIPSSPFVAGTGPCSLAASPNGQYLYVANNGSDNVSAYTIGAGGVLTHVGDYAAGNSPFSVAVDASGANVYVTNYNSEDQGTITAYSIGNGGALTTGTTVYTGQYPYTVATDPTGRFAYVANNGVSNGISVFTGNGSGSLLPTVVPQQSAPLDANTLVVDPSGRFVYVASHDAQQIAVYGVDGATGALVALSGSVDLSATYEKPLQLAVSPDGRFLFATLDTQIVPTPPPAAPVMHALFSDQGSRQWRDNGSAAVTGAAGQGVFILFGCHEDNAEPEPISWQISANYGGATSDPTSGTFNSPGATRQNLYSWAYPVSHWNPDPVHPSVYYYTVTLTCTGGDVGQYTATTTLSAYINAQSSGGGLQPSEFNPDPSGTSTNERLIAVWSINGTTGALAPITGSACGTGGQTNCFAAGNSPFALKVNPTGSKLIVTEQHDNYLYILDIDSESGALTTDAACGGGICPAPTNGSSPVALAVTTSQGDHAYVYVADQDADALSRHNITAFKIYNATGIAPVKIGSLSDTAADAGQNGIAVDAGGHCVFTPVPTYSEVQVYKLGTEGVPSYYTNYGVGSYPGSMQVDPRGKYLYVVNYNSRTVSGFSINLNTCALTPLTGSPYATDAGSKPIALAVEPTGRYLYVANNAVSGSPPIDIFTITPGTGVLVPFTPIGATTSVGSREIAVITGP